MTKEKEDRVERDVCLAYASMYYLTIKDNFVSASKEAAKKYGINLTHELEKLMEASYKIGFADAMGLGIDHDED